MIILKINYLKNYKDKEGEKRGSAKEKKEMVVTKKKGFHEKDIERKKGDFFLK